MKRPVILCLALAGVLAARTWTDVDGREVEADYVSHDAERVVMRLPDGRSAEVELERLSQADREFLATMNEPAEEDDGLNWDAPWPDDVVFRGDPEIAVEEESELDKRFVYSSANYRFICDAPLSKSVVSTFADMFEATRLACRSLPLAITGGRQREGKYDILLFEEEESYFKAGGPPGSAGVFMGARNLVMVPLESLGVRQVGSSYMRDRDKSDGTLVHELTHQLTPSEYFLPGAMGWFSEGLAEYLTATPYGNGRIHFRNNLDEIQEYIVAHGEDGTGGRALGEEIGAPRLEEFMLMPYREFTGVDANFNYGFGLLLTAYFLHLDGEGDAARIKEFLKGLRAADRRDHDPRKALEPLLDGRSFAELEEDVADAWRRKRVKIEFPEE